jgi:hypothetical protein
MEPEDHGTKGTSKLRSAAQDSGADSCLDDPGMTEIREGMGFRKLRRSHQRWRPRPGSATPLLLVSGGRLHNTPFSFSLL